MGKFESIEIPIINIVTPVNDTLPLTGKWSPDFDISGWIWDKRRLPSFNDVATTYNTFIGGHAYGLRDGTTEDYWQTGAITGLEFYDIKQFRKYGDFISWTPRVKVGEYSIFWDIKKLYSDHSFTGYIDPLLNFKGVNFHPLRDDALHNTVSVILYQRDEDFLRRPYIDLEYVHQFTGEISGDTRLETETGDQVNLDGILFDNLAERKHEFIIRYDEEEESFVIVANKDFMKSVGQTDIDITDETLSELFEDIGIGQSDGRDLFTSYFPILNDDSLRVIVRHAGGAKTELKKTESLNFSRIGDDHYSVDADLGIISLSGYQAPQLVLASTIDPDDVEIEFRIDDAAIGSYPDQGIIIINGEEILYYGKSRTVFYDCVRGYGGPVPPSTHEIGSIIEDIKHGNGTKSTDTIYLSYVAVPRVEYEVTSYDIRSANKSRVVDCKAISNVETNQIIQINPVERNVAELILSTDKGQIGGNIFGPVYYGTDFAKLTAQALDTKGNPVEDIEITIVLNEDTGSLNGSLQTYTAISNSAGEIYAFYNAPYDWESICKEVTKVEHTGSNTKFTIEELPPNLTAESIQVYQILKHDPVIGTIGERVLCNSGENTPYFAEGAGAAMGFCALRVDGQWEDPVSKWEGGFLDVICSNGVKRRRNIVHVFEDYYTIDDLDTDSDGLVDHPELVGAIKETVFLLDQEISDFNTGHTPLKVWLFEPEAEEWNSSWKDGARVVLYEWRDDVPHPLTGDDGAYYPVRPDDVHPTYLKFNDRHLPIPSPTIHEDPWDPTDPDYLAARNLNLGGYIIVSSDIVSFYAWCKDPISGRRITSNEIKLRLDIPAYLNGVDQANPALPIPYGFTFVCEDFNVGTGIGGANFITINPKASGVMSYSLCVLGTGSECTTP